jgi:ketosteroid isomerase-like protein
MDKPPVTPPERLQWFYEQLASTRERALESLTDVFTDDIVFRDPFRETRGLLAFRELFARMFRQYRAVNFTDLRIAGAGEQFTLTYDMHLRMIVGPVFVTPLASVCRVRDGLVFELHDYYDLASGLLSPVAALRGAYRTAVRALFL